MWSLRLLLGGGILLVCTAIAPAVAWARSQAPGDDAGDVVVVDAVNMDRELEEFEGSTPFRLLLPPNATCSGDSANDDYRVQTFLVPADTDLATLRYGYRNPEGNDLYRALRSVDGELASQLMTDQNPGPNQPALILDFRLPFTFEHYPEGSLPPGRWTIGVACTEPGATVERYWDAQIELVAASDARPKGLRIRVVDAEGAVSSESSSGSAVPFVAIAVAAVGGAAFFMFVRSRRHTPTHTKETS